MINSDFILTLKMSRHRGSINRNLFFFFTLFLFYLSITSELVINYTFNDLLFVVLIKNYISFSILILGSSVLQVDCKWKGIDSSVLQVDIWVIFYFFNLT